MDDDQNIQKLQRNFKIYSFIQYCSYLQLGFVLLLANILMF